jgi:predicted DNA-binding transcriptional regulator AlpA
MVSTVQGQQAVKHIRPVEVARLTGMGIVWCYTQMQPGTFGPPGPGKRLTVSEERVRDWVRRQEAAREIEKGTPPIDRVLKALAASEDPLVAAWAGKMLAAGEPAQCNHTVA